VCLLIALSRIVPGVPLIVAANRDELYQRPGVPMTVLQDRRPRILGGRDELAGGTWLAVNEHGLVAGLTNQPSAGRDPTRRSRGELPIAFAAYPDAATAVAQVCARLDPADYNPCWLLVGDRHRLYSIDVTGGHQPAVEELPPGAYVLENAPLRRDSAKQRYIAVQLAAAQAGPAAQVVAALATVLADHQPAAGPQPAGADAPARPAAVSAACVHTARYGTRSAMIVSVGASGRPRLSVADGPPCTEPLLDETGRWASPAAGLAAG
jgi:uncharacterized protein with NRDE domain